MGRVE